LIAAKQALPHGEWEQMFACARPVKVSIRSAQMLMKVAGHPVLAKTNHGSLLPPSWRTLYELTKLPDAVLRKALTDGRIHPDMQRREVVALRDRLRPAPVITRAPWTEICHDVHARIYRAFSELPGTEQRCLVDALRKLLDQLEDEIKPGSEERESNPTNVVSTAATDEPAAPEAAFVCTSCERGLTEEELVEVRECPQREERFDGAEGRNCPSCNRPFSRLISEQGCPDCLGDEGEIVPAAEVLAAEAAR
jgi:hypothetical protein